MKRFLVFVCVFLMFSFTLYSQTMLENQFSGPLGSGARAMGMGGAFIAVADDATATSWNPGGLGQIEHIEVSGVGSYYDYTRLEPSLSMHNFFAGTAYHTGDSWSFDFFSISVPIRPIKSSDFKIVLQYSYQRFINMNINSQTNAIAFQNISTEYHGVIPVIWMEEGYIYKSEQYEGGLDSHSFSIGAKLTSWANVGLTVNFWTNGFSGGEYIEEAFSATNLLTGETFTGWRQEENLSSANFTGTSINIGALFHVTDSFNIGLVYKNEFIFQDKDDAGNLKSEVHYPASYGIGLAYRPLDNLTLAADFTFTEWSEGRIEHGGNVFYFPLSDLSFMETIPEETQEFKQMYQHDTYQLRFGGEYVFISEDFLIPLRAGIYFDKQYFADANNAIPLYSGITLGAGVVWKGIVIDFAINYLSARYQSNYFSAANTEFHYIKGIGSLIIRL